MDFGFFRQPVGQPVVSRRRGITGCERAVYEKPTWSTVIVPEKITEAMPRGACDILHVSRAILAGP